ncbi:copper chaperone PCu(A)C [Streptomyces cavernicola]|uniref:Copper chaperone PCu(A)C n=1 Tax=Streptomyces cavernicola TaxID=3043613 RepID=A0ABT6S3M4_9ACTN|nr:copper chaperone PCu(A)C [Streptomyces sp. B-S-A6]MDI3402692.1 copper chaperone PCu(A)C [Streptomyces sp. B-S-A6]
MTPRKAHPLPGHRPSRSFARSWTVVAIAAASALALAGCSSSDGADKEPAADAKPQLSVTGAYMPEPVTKDMGGGFLTIANKGGADKLTSVTTESAKSAGLHETVDQKMKMVKAFDIPAGGALKLERGGNHIMFHDLTELPKKGDKIAVELHFEKSAPIKAELDVKAPTYNPHSH